MDTFYRCIANYKIIIFLKEQKMCIGLKSILNTIHCTMTYHYIRHCAVKVKTYWTTRHVPILYFYSRHMNLCSKMFQLTYLTFAFVHLSSFTSFFLFVELFGFLNILTRIIYLRFFTVEQVYIMCHMFQLNISYCHCL